MKSKKNLLFFSNSSCLQKFSFNSFSTQKKSLNLIFLKSIFKQFFFAFYPWRFFLFLAFISYCSRIAGNIKIFEIWRAKKSDWTKLKLLPFSFSCGGKINLDKISIKSHMYYRIKFQLMAFLLFSTHKFSLNRFLNWGMFALQFPRII